MQVPHFLYTVGASLSKILQIVKFTPQSLMVDLFLDKQQNFLGRKRVFRLRTQNYQGYHSEIKVHSDFPVIILDLAFKCFLAFLYHDTRVC